MRFDLLHQEPPQIRRRALVPIRLAKVCATGFRNISAAVLRDSALNSQLLPRRVRLPAMAAQQTRLPAGEKRPLARVSVRPAGCRNPDKHAIPAAIPKAAPPTMKNTLQPATPGPRFADSAGCPFAGG